MFHAAKAGHTGTLDPLASGLLPVCFGEATKFSGFLLASAKTYEASLQLGATSTTGDAEGVLSKRVPVQLTEAQVNDTLKRFVGVRPHLPPMHSAIKRRGQPLYSLARAGIEVPRAERQIQIFALDRLDLEADLLRVRLRCSKGTYVRVLAGEIGTALGCGAYLAALRRTEVGRFSVARAHTLDELAALEPAARDLMLLPIDTLVADLPRVSLDETQVSALRQGRAVSVEAAAPAGPVRVYAPQLGFVGAGALSAWGELRALRLLAQTPVSAS
jgi:tRNA pseudouridine55 synthase